MTAAPELVDRGVYVIRGRNFAVAAYDAEKKLLVGVRTKFGEKFLSGETFYDPERGGGSVMGVLRQLGAVPSEVGPIDVENARLLVWLDAGLLLPI